MMSISVNVKGYVSRDNDTYIKYKNVLIACVNAGVSELPKECAIYFGQTEPSFHLLDNNIETVIPNSKYFNQVIGKIENLVSEIPDDVHKLVFTYQ